MPIYALIAFLGAVIVVTATLDWVRAENSWTNTVQMSIDAFAIVVGAAMLALGGIAWMFT